MRKITFALTLIFCVNLVFSNPVDTTLAKRVAVNFWKQNSAHNKKVPDFIYLSLAPTYTGFYVFNSTEKGGFVIVSADDRVQPILGYSEESTFDTSNMPPNLREWLMGYEQQIHYAIDESIEPTGDIVNEWNALLEGGIVAPKSPTSVDPLLTTQWDQYPYYNELCPTNIFASNGHTLTGCVATAMAQVMKYWNYPMHGSGYHSYHCSFYGTQSANFANTTYDWSHMPNQLTATSSSTQVNAVATLMYHCGVSVDMNYGAINGSSAYTSNVANALKSYFRYDNSTLFVSKANYSESGWISLLKAELNAGRPIVYDGHGDAGGHAFVCDGYNNNNFFHFNWGWGGACNNAYFSINNLSPGSYNFTSNQGAVIGIQPSTSSSPAIEMYSNLSVNDAWFLSNITGSVQIVNTGTNSFSGYLAVVLFNEEEIAVDEQIFNISNLAYNHYTTKTINISGGTHLIPGTYYALALYSEDGNNWDLVSNGTNAYPVTTFDITYSAQVETNSFFSNTSFVQGQTATVNVDVLNSGSETFYGKVGIKLARVDDGSIVQTIQEFNVTNGLPSNNHYTNGLTFTGTITATPGTYLMVLAYQRTGQTQWYYAGSSNYPNPVFVTVVAAPTLSVSPSAISFQQTGGNQVVNVTSNISWTATSSASWLSISPNSGTESEAMIVTATVNNSNSSRSATITITGNGGVSPQTITVTQLGGIQPDIYEPNNTSATSYNLGTVNTNSTNYNVNANFHITTDADYYKINLPSGFSYTINANILNSYNNTSYTADAKFATSQNGNSWSSNYGNSMSAMTMSDGGTLYFRVLPYTDHEIGTYQLHVSIARTGGLQPDMYEPNNSVNTAYLLASITENETSIDAEASFHSSSDVDYYKIDLPPDYIYSVTTQLIDQTNNSSYTVDAKIAVSTDYGNTWSSYYNNSIPTMTFEHFGRPYYRVVPQQDGTTGTYKLHLTVSRATGISYYEENIVVFPNPTYGEIKLLAPASWQINLIEVLNLSGKVIKSVFGETESFDISELCSGLYFLRIHTSSGIIHQKVIKK